MKGGLKVVRTNLDRAAEAMALNEKRIESVASPLCSRWPPRWAQWKEDWKPSATSATNPIFSFWLNEKRIESESNKSRTRFTRDSASQWKEDWKCWSLSMSSSRLSDSWLNEKRIERHSWAVPPQLELEKRHSMKRGLKAVFVKNPSAHN